MRQEGQHFDKAENLAKERNTELSEEIFKEVIEKLGNPKEIAKNTKSDVMNCCNFAIRRNFWSNNS